MRAWTYLPDLAGAQLPRYTSYPPANRFGSDVGAQDVLSEISGLPDDADLSIYIHIPFCNQLCWYCGCHASVPTRANPLDPYVEALLAEIDLVGRASGPRRVSHVHFGGGSPNVLSPEQIDAVFGRLNERFELDADAEICAELDPRSVSEATVSAFAGNGLSRASVGVQVLDGKIQSLINRIQPQEVIDTVLMRLRSAGVGSINMDVMYGLPAQTIGQVLETVDYAISREADRVAVFGYAHVPWFRKHQGAIKTASLPGGEERFRQAEAAARRFALAGYERIGFDHFALPGDAMAKASRSGRLRRNFQGYTADGAQHLLGFGASAISSVGGLHFQNTPDTSKYRQRVSEGVLAVERGARLSEQDVVIGRAISDLLCRFEVELGEETSSGALAALEDMERHGVVELAGRRVRVTEMGRPYVRNVAAILDPGHQDTPRRHSLAV